MSETKWSPEPWHRWPYSDREWDIGRGAEQDPDAPVIAAGASEADARRIVACVNALAGVPTEALEAGVLAEALEMLRRLSTGEDLVSEIDHDMALRLRALGKLP